MQKDECGGVVGPIKCILVCEDRRFEHRSWFDERANVASAFVAAVEGWIIEVTDLGLSAKPSLCQLDKTFF